MFIIYQIQFNYFFISILQNFYNILPVFGIILKKGTSNGPAGI
jgi:hypothetical protein